MSAWRDERNQRSLARLRRALPAIFPGPVLTHALARALTPPTPRRAIESYWAAHPVRADRLARALAGRSGSPAGWEWRGEGQGRAGARGFRSPPAPFREERFSRGPGHCCVCGQPVFRYGWHRDLWDDRKPNVRASWHGCCIAAWKLWNAPTDSVSVLKRMQKHRCAQSGRRLLRSAEVDHRTPLFRVWRDCRQHPWPELLAYWGTPNLQVINREVHAAKCAAEAASRAMTRAAAAACHPR